MAKPRDYYVVMFGRALRNPELNKPLKINVDRVVVAGDGKQRKKIIKSPQSIARFFKMPEPKNGGCFIAGFSRVTAMKIDHTNQHRRIIIGDNGPQKTFTFAKRNWKGYLDSKIQTFSAVAVIKIK